MLFETFSLSLFFTHAIPREARSPKKSVIQAFYNFSVMPKSALNVLIFIFFNFSILLLKVGPNVTQKRALYVKNTSLVAPGALAHRLQRRTACNAAPPATPLRPTYTPQIKKRRSLLYSNLGAPINFRKTSFLIRATFCLPSPYGGRQTSLGPPKSKNGDHFSIVIWAL